MNKFWEKVEHYNGKLIPFAIVALLFVIVFELFINTENHLLELSVEILDYFVLAIFIIDLIFLGIKARTVKFFFKNYWLDMVAVIPIALILAIFSYFYSVFMAVERISLTQAILHESLETKKIATAVTKEAQAVSRTSKIAKFARIFTRGLRVITKSRFFTSFKEFFTDFKEKHHLARKGIKTRKHQRKTIGRRKRLKKL